MMASGFATVMVKMDSPADKFSPACRSIVLTAPSIGAVNITGSVPAAACATFCSSVCNAAIMGCAGSLVDEVAPGDSRFFRTVAVVLTRLERSSTSASRACGFQGDVVGIVGNQFLLV